MNTKVIHDLTAGALNGMTTFPETVKRLIDIGVERYYADLVRMEKTFYTPNDEACLERLPLTDRPLPADSFQAEGVVAAIRSIQAGQIDYPEFLRRIIAKGCVSYTVYIGGKFAIYNGRHGESYIEKFPNAEA